MTAEFDFDSTPNLTLDPELETALEEKTERWMYLMELKEKIDAQQ